MTRSILLGSLAGLMIFAAVSLADRAPANEAPPPKIPAKNPPKAEGVQFVVKIDPTAKVSRLILPPEAAGGEGIGELAPPPAAAPKASDGAFFESSTRTIFAGLCLSLAIGAIFFVPRSSGAVQLVLLGVVGLGVSGIAAVALANKAPLEVPPAGNEARTMASGQVKVEWSGRKGTPITLILTVDDAKPRP